jgi:hypothetical protein
MPGEPSRLFDIAEQLRLLATSYSEPRKQRLLLGLARLCEREPAMLAGSRRAIDDSKTLLAEVETLLR